MLSIGKLAVGPATGRYYVDQVAQGREDYYAGEGEDPGVWLGTGAAALSVSGRVWEQGVVRLLSGCNPASGEALRRPLARGAVAGFDLTFKAPKSVSIGFGSGDPDVGERSFAPTRRRWRRPSATSSARREEASASTELRAMGAAGFEPATSRV